MGKAPRVTARDVVKVLEQTGFTLSRSRGSHFIYAREDGRRATVPVHGSDILHPKTLAAIFRDADLTIDEFEERLKGK